jgi:hypothetical protein
MTGDIFPKQLFRRNAIMKKMLLLTLAAFLLCGFAGRAMASYFADGDLIRVVYQTSYNGVGQPTGGTYEYASDLGSLNTLEANTTLTQAGSSFGSFSTNYYTAASGANPATGLQVAYFVADLTSGAYNYNIYLGSKNAAQPNLNGSYNGLYDSLTSVQENGYQVAAGGTLNDVKVTQASITSYWNVMQGNGSYYGSYQQNIPVGAGEAGLAPLATGGSIIMSLYAYDYNGGTDGAVLSNNGKTLEIETLVVGGNPITEVGPMATPIPPSMLLLGTGFLGLIGFRRKSHKA